MSTKTRAAALLVAGLVFIAMLIAQSLNIWQPYLNPGGYKVVDSCNR